MFSFARLASAGRLLWAAALSTLLAAGFAAPSYAHEGEDHGGRPPASPGQASPRLEAFSDAFELVAMLRDERLVIYLDRFADNAPVPGAVIEVNSDAGSARAAETEPGVYAIAAEWAGTPGSYSLVFTVTAGETVDLLNGTLEIQGGGAVRKGVEGLPASWTTLGTTAAFVVLGAGIAFGRGRTRAVSLLVLMMVVGVVLARSAFAHEGEDHGSPKTAPAGPASGPSVLPDGSIFVPKPMQRLLEVRTSIAKPLESAKTVEIPGQVVSDPNSIGRVQSTRNGRLQAPKEGFPTLGQKVKPDQVLAFLDPSMDLIDRLDLEERIRSLDQQETLARNRVQRYSRLTGVVAQQQIDEARIELQGVERRRLVIEPLLKQQDALRAPIDGVIAQTNAVAGQVVTAQDILFEVANPDRLWVEASAFDFASLGGLETASGVTPAGERLSLRFAGRGYTLRQQAIPLQFRIERSTATLPIGTPVTVILPTQQRASGLQVARDSVVRDAGGQEFVWEHNTAERFMQRPVRTQPLDGTSVLIMSGIDPGARVVTTGAELLNQIR